MAWVLVRQGGYHEVWMLGGRLVAIPRHREIGERPARAMLKALEEELGDGWWER